MAKWSPSLRRGGYIAGIVIFLLLLTIQAASASESLQTAAPPSSPGNAENGRAIFVDEVKLANRGPACIGCHSINELGLLGGGVVGPNLTQASVKYGNDGLLAALTDIPFPTMAPIFAKHPLTPNEVADLSAYIISVAGQPQQNKEILVLGLSLAAFLGAMAVGAFIWRGRLGLVRARLVNQSRPRKQKP